MQRKTTIWQSTQKSMSRIYRWLSWCRASSQRSTSARPLPGCIITGTLPMKALSSSEVTSICLLKLSPPLWRNRPSPQVAVLLVAQGVIAHGIYIYFGSLINYFTLLFSIFLSLCQVIFFLVWLCHIPIV